MTKKKVKLDDMKMDKIYQVLTKPVLLSKIDTGMHQKLTIYPDEIETVWEVTEVKP